ncbi:MAG: hypothetical protein R3C30_16410 [Hyphomonadaceae bacterium]
MRFAWLAAIACLAAPSAFAQQGAGAIAMMQAADSNGDGAITRAEAQAARGVMFERLDADHDGYISEAERTNANRQGGQARRGLEGTDTNHDGRISRAEMMNQPYRGFDRLDRNHDDVLSAEELEAARNFMRAR